MKRVAKFISTMGGIGFTPGMPGTAGSFAALPLAAVIHYWGGPYLLFAAAIGVSLIGIWACDIYTRQNGIHDPSECVIDELAGQWFACAFVPLSLAGFTLAFLLFRILDMTKPWPISAAERNIGGLGVMLDDIVAGLIAGLILLALQYWIAL